MVVRQPLLRWKVAREAELKCLRGPDSGMRGKALCCGS